MPASKQFRPTRSELQTIFKEQRLIRAFELVFQALEEMGPLASQGTINANLINNQTILLESSETLSNNAGAGAGTLANAPSAGNPTKWIAIDDNGTTRYIPTWT